MGICATSGGNRDNRMSQIIECIRLTAHDVTVDRLTPRGDQEAFLLLQESDLQAYHSIPRNDELHEMLLALLQYGRLVGHHLDHNYRSRGSSTANYDVEYCTCYNSGYPESRIHRILRDSARTWRFQIYQQHRLVKIGNRGLLSSNQCEELIKK